MVRGIGVDIVELEQFEKVEKNEGFLQEVFTERERDDIAGRNLRGRFYAMLFSAKESTLKSLGCGLHFGFHWHDIEINSELKPQLHGLISNLADEASVSKINIAASRSRKYSVAFVIIEDQKG